MSKLNNAIRLALAAALVAGFGLPRIAVAQGKGHDKAKHVEKAAKPDKGDHDARLVRAADGTIVQPLVVTQPARRVPPGLAKKPVTAPHAVLVTRSVLVDNGYQIVQVVPRGTSQVIYYRRGNNGVGRGLGPIQRIVVVPAGQTVQFQSVPQSLLATILSRLGM
jgi:hypothetical protein